MRPSFLLHTNFLHRDDCIASSRLRTLGKLCALCPGSTQSEGSVTVVTLESMATVVVNLPIRIVFAWCAENTRRNEEKRVLDFANRFY